MFRAGSAQPKAVPLALITRLEEIDAHKIELSNGRHMVQYRGQLMPLVSMNDKRAREGRGRPAAAGVLGRRRSMALVVDEIVDIVEDHLDIQVGSDNSGVLGSAIIKGQATEIIDVGHFLPLAFEDWFRRKEQTAQHAAAHGAADRQFPVLPQHADAGAAGRRLRGDRRGVRAGGAGDVQGRPRFRRRSSPISRCPRWTASNSPNDLRGDPRTADLPMIALSSVVSAEAVERGRQVGFHDYVAKFDRQGLIAALKEQTDVGRAA